MSPFSSFLSSVYHTSRVSETHEPLEYTRRDFLGTLAGLVAAAHAQPVSAKEGLVTPKRLPVPGQKEFPRKGPDLRVYTFAYIGRNRIETNLPQTTLDQILNISAEQGDNVYPVANGIVTYVGERLQYFGRWVEVYHDLFWANYSFMDEVYAKDGQNVTRKDPIGRASIVSENSVIFGYNIGLGVKTTQIGKLYNLPYDVSSTKKMLYFDPVELAAFDVKDSNGRKTLPYWYGDDMDGHLDEEFKRHYEQKVRFFNEVLQLFPKGMVEAHLASYFPNNDKRVSWDMKKGIDRLIGQKVMFLYEKLLEGNQALGKTDTDKILHEIKEFLSFPPMLTAPKKNPEMKNLYNT